MTAVRLERPGRRGLDKPTGRKRDGLTDVAGPSRYDIGVEGVIDRRWTA